MDVTPLIPAGHKIIQAYGDGGFRVNGDRIEGSILLFPTQVLSWPVQSLADVTVETLQAVREAVPAVEILLLGTGAVMQIPPAALRRELRHAGMIVDAMDTGAACRTYSVLLAEGRRVAAALLAV